jgi:hypothetical protein
MQVLKHSQEERTREDSVIGKIWQNTESFSLTIINDNILQGRFCLEKIPLNGSWAKWTENNSN